MSYADALAYARGPGVAAIVGLLISIACEWWPAFQASMAKTRVLVYVILCFVVPAAATALSIATGEFGSWADIARTWWPAVASGVAAATLGTLYHAYVPEPVAAKATNAANLAK
jgi:hypothetical protein